MKEIIAMHGWAGDSNQWSNWIELFTCCNWKWQTAERGYKNISSQNLSYLITNRDNNSPAIFYETMLSKFALSQGVSEDKVDDWKKQLNKSEKVGNFGFTSFPVLTAAYLG